jgi:hypothetical protein
MSNLTNIEEYFQNEIIDLEYRKRKSWSTKRTDKMFDRDIREMKRLLLTAQRMRESLDKHGELVGQDFELEL